MTPAPVTAPTKPLTTEWALTAALASATSRKAPTFHVCRERDVGLFSLVQQMVANVPWALAEGRVPIADLGSRTCYWTPAGRRGTRSVWEYYFEPLVCGFPAAIVPSHVGAALEPDFFDGMALGRMLDEHIFVTSHFGDHLALKGVAPIIPFESAAPSDALRAWTSAIISRFVQPRSEVAERAERFFDEHLRGHEVLGVHVRGTDATSAHETRAYRRGSLDLDRYALEISKRLAERPGARVLVATDSEASLAWLLERFGDQVVALDAVRYRGGEPAGKGPTGCIMPAYVAADRERAAQNGEDAVVEYLLLRRSNHLVHNGSSLAVTVLLAQPLLPHTNTHRRV